MKFWRTLNKSHPELGARRGVLSLPPHGQYRPPSALPEAARISASAWRALTMPADKNAQDCSLLVWTRVASDNNKEQCHNG